MMKFHATLLYIARNVNHPLVQHTVYTLVSHLVLSELSTYCHCIAVLVYLSKSYFVPSSTKAVMMAMWIYQREVNKVFLLCKKVEQVLKKKRKKNHMLRLLRTMVRTNLNP